MELNLSEFLLKLGKQQKEEILKQVYKEMDLNFDNSKILYEIFFLINLKNSKKFLVKSLLTFSNAENDGLRLGGNKEISNFVLIYKYEY